MKKINEIFYSLQGEGYHVGTPAVFIRFSGCNLKCSFCDTQHDEGSLLTDDEIIKKINAYPTNMVILTGGEPSLWINRDFIDLLHGVGKYVCIETNGTHTLPSNIDWVTCSPKDNHKVVLDKIDELKVVYLGQNIQKYKRLKASYYFLQPCSCQNTKEVVELILKEPTWRLSLQTHKLINIL